MVSFTYNNAPSLLFWQGIRKFFDNYYIICGSNQYEQGILNIGPILNYNSDNNYIIMYPGAITTSIYGPNYVGSDYYSLVGSYKKKNDNFIYGFYFEGKLSDLNNSNNYKTIFNGPTYTYIHSTIGNLLGGNYDTYNLGPIGAFIMIIPTGRIINVIYPGSTSNTIYGIWYNGGKSYTLCGGYSTDTVTNTDVYKKSQPVPIGKAYLVNYNIETDKFENWTTFTYPYSKNEVLTHFQGISSSKSNVYEIAADTIDIGLKSSWVRIIKNEYGNFFVDKWIDYKYPLPGTITSANSVANNVLVGTYINESGDAIAYQTKINL